MDRAPYDSVAVPRSDVVPLLGACLSNARLLRPPQIGIFL